MVLRKYVQFVRVHPHERFAYNTSRELKALLRSLEAFSSQSHYARHRVMRIASIILGAFILIVRSAYGAYYLLRAPHLATCIHLWPPYTYVSTWLEFCFCPLRKRKRKSKSQRGEKGKCPISSYMIWEEKRGQSFNCTYRKLFNSINLRSRFNEYCRKLNFAEFIFYSFCCFRFVRCGNWNEIGSVPIRGT